MCVKEKLHRYPPPPPPPPPPINTHAGQPRFLRCSVVNLSPFEEKNTILELEQANQRLKDINQELRGQLQDIMEPREMRQDFIPMDHHHHQHHLQILPWDACPQMMDDPRTVQVPKQKLYTHEEPFTEKSQKELQHMRMSLERKKSSISEVWDGMSEVHMSLTDQAEGLLNLKKNIQDVLDEVEDIRVEILRDKAQCQNLAEKSLLIQEKKSSQPPLRVPASRSEKNQSWPEKAWTVLTKAGLCLFVGSVLFYVYIVTPNPYENLFPPLIGQRTIWRIRSWFSPFLRVEVDDFLPF
ncbi:coiled-coil domain-containing protein 188 isoform X2 [Macrotis lagotis]|uniref:coiled-coil domain-containing protein 188 isoform X2 n=1 Tax=Macrotis lagotis TaxID=92651 RepID=UPI003D69CDF1